MTEPAFESASGRSPSAWLPIAGLVLVIGLAIYSQGSQTSPPSPIPVSQESPQSSAPDPEPAPERPDALPGRILGPQEAAPAPTNLVFSALGIRPLDPRSLVPLTDAPLGTLPRTIRPVQSSGDVVVVEVGDRSSSEIQSVVVHRLAPPTDPARWIRTEADPLPRRTWITATDDRVAWAIESGSIQIRRPRAAGFQRVFLPDDRLVVDGRFVDDTRLGLLLQARDNTLSYMLLDTASREATVDIELTGLPDGLPGTSDIAWDVPSGRLYLQRSLSSSLTAVDLPTGQVHTLEVPIQWPVLGVRARAGLVVVFPLGDRSIAGRVPNEVVVVDSDLTILSTRSDLPLADIVVAEDGTIIGVQPGGQIVAYDADLAETVRLPSLADNVALLGLRDDVLYIAAEGGALAPDRRLLSIDFAAGIVLARRPFADGALFLTEGAILLEP